MTHDTLIRKEAERQHPVYYSTSSHRDGLDVLNFLMDLVNHIAGYSEKYYEEIHSKMDHEQLVSKYRAERDQYDGKIEKSPLLGDHSPHCLLILEGVQELYRMKGSG